jgi:antirestriction protein ArdC
MNTNSTPKADVYTRVTDKIVAALEAGVRPWMQPWSVEHAAGKISRPLRANGKPYQGVNVLLLWGEAMDKGYVAPFWMTFKQALELGGRVRKGEHGSLVVYADTFRKTETDEETGEEMERAVPFMKGYTVFNVEQVEDLPERYYVKPAAPLPISDRLEQADRFFRNTGAEIRYGGNRAYYSIKDDYIQMPPYEAFRDAESFAATLAHEACHWTRAATRLNRDLGRKHWGDEGYAREERVAELGSAFLCADLGLAPEVLEDHAAYINSWVKVLTDDKRFIFTAAGHAQRAVEYLHSLQNALVENPETEAA